MNQETIRETTRRVDHTLLAPAAVWEEIRKLCDDAAEFGTASVHSAGFCAPRQRISGRKSSGLYRDRVPERISDDRGQGF